MKKITPRLLRLIWTVFFVSWGVGLLLLVLIWHGVIGYMPPIEQLQNPIDKYASQLISADGKTIGSYAHSGNNRVYTSFDELAPDLVNALIATEDVRFHRHSGIDARSLGRAVVKRGILRQKGGGGGSTITQQLAKQLYSPNAKSVLERLLQKPIEWVIAVKIEKYYTKKEIIALYLNQFDFLYNAVGIRSAAHTYFGKLPKDLTLEESALLVGMCKNPAIYNPVLHSDSNLPLERRNVVLGQMLKAGYITQDQYEKAVETPIKTRFSRNTISDGTAPYFREYVRLLLTAKKPVRREYPKWNLEQYSRDSLAWETDPMYGWCNKNKKADGSNYDLYSDGLKIYCTIDSRMQQYAEQAVEEHVGHFLQPIFQRELKGLSNAPYSNDITNKQKKEMLERAIRQSDRWRTLKKEGLSDEEVRATFNVRRKMRLWTWSGEKKEVNITPLDSIIYYKSILRTGFMAMNPHNGNILAYVGGPDFRTFKYDMVSQGHRQVGSTIKPFLYSLSLFEGTSPCETIIHQPVTLMVNGKPWTPRNTSSRRVGEPVTIKWGLQNSSNWVTTYLMGRTSPRTFVRLLRSFGITGNIDPVVSLALGTPDVSVSEMVSAYSTFVSQGIKVAPLPITRIEDQYGNVVASFTPRITEVLPKDVALKMLDMMRSVIDGGTGGRLRSVYGLKMPLGGKTGTTQRNSDGWFVGFTPSIVAGCWVGGDERSIHFRSMAYGQGAASALPVFGKFIRSVYADPRLGYSVSEQFNVPSDFSPCGDDFFWGDGTVEEGGEDLDAGGDYLEKAEPTAVSSNSIGTTTNAPPRTK